MALFVGTGLKDSKLDCCDSGDVEEAGVVFIPEEVLEGVEVDLSGESES